MNQTPGAVLHTHAPSRAGSKLLQALFWVGVVVAIQFLVRTEGDHFYGFTFLAIALGGVFAVRWLSAQRPRVIAVHENGIVLLHSGILGRLGARQVLVPFEDVKSVRQDRDMDGTPAFLFELKGQFPLRLTPMTNDKSALDALATTIVTRAGLHWNGPLAVRGG